MTRHRIALALALTTLGAATACSRHRVLLEPNVALAPHSRIGLVTFTAENVKGNLTAFATQRFQEHLLRAQPGIEILELGVVPMPIDVAKIKALGAQHGVKTIMVGHLIISDVKPRISIFGGINASAEATLSLNTRLLSTESGATLWARSSQLRETIASLSMDGGIPVFGAQDPAEAYGEVVNQLVWNVTTDFRGTWVKQ
jgi:hypothetical protein